MNRNAGAWEVNAIIFVVDTLVDKAVFTELISTCERDLKDTDILLKSQPQIDLAKRCIAGDENGKFICMFLWDYINKAFFPLCTGIFEETDVRLIKDIAANFVDMALKCCSPSVEVRALSDSNPLLAELVCVLCENQLLRNQIANNQVQNGLNNGQ
jgi:hypothetical protein